MRELVDIIGLLGALFPYVVSLVFVAGVWSIARSLGRVAWNLERVVNRWDLERGSARARVEKAAVARDGIE